MIKNFSIMPREIVAQSLEDEIKKLDDQGIIHAIRSKSDLDEASSSYKDIDVVMEEQKDLVDIVIKLQPLAVIKG
ncbi:MAG TPA: RtcB family protein [Candidatus Paceibacterota bacterium]|nr:RtcB family protein [Candidatus Paceibacterota bacterium]